MHPHIGSSRHQQMAKEFHSLCLSLSVCFSARLEGEVSGVYLQSPHCGGQGGERDSGYDSLRRRMSVLDRLSQTHPVWLLLAVSEEEASRILLRQPPGVRGRRRDTRCECVLFDYCLTWNTS